MLSQLPHILLAVLAIGASVPARPKAPAGPLKWELKFTENFNGKELNTKLWERIDRGDSDWNRNMSLRDDLVRVGGGFATLLGVVNDDKSSDGRSVLTGGISTRGRFNMKYCKIEVRAKLQAAKGAWPAIWLMPQQRDYPWPKCGEIDIIERLNFDPFVYHTVHSEATKSGKSPQPGGGRGKIKPDAWNVYALEWYPEKIVWKVNGSVTHEYAKTSDDVSLWPWTKPFYLMIDMQLGGSWVGPVDESGLPVAMQIDWVKFYQLKQGAATITEFARPK